MFHFLTSHDVAVAGMEKKMAQLINQEMSPHISTRSNKFFDGNAQYVLLHTLTSSILHKLNLSIGVIILEYPEKSVTKFYRSSFLISWTTGTIYENLCK